MEPIESAAEAVAILENTRSTLVERGREIAVTIAQEHGTVHSRQVRDQLATEGLLKGVVDERFLGAVFAKRGLFEKTGKEHIAVDKERNIHARPVPIWRLK
jgi:hypothetical protein